MKTVNDIRSEFLSFFKKQGHEVVASSPLVPQNDPTLMFANSGMVQFKNVFTGAEKRPYTRATTAQKSVRAGGKHNDLDNVGYTARHLTFFEMMGNFSFGDYFKEEAISFAWELITKNFGMPKDKLLVTVYHTDDEAADLWKKIAGFSDDKIIRINTNANFWMMGDTGPCGPCSEIFIDQGEQIFGGPPGSPDEDGDRFLEFWNLVFMQYEQEPDGQGGYIRKPLPKPSIDTGMGLERFAGIMQGKHSVFDIDLLRAIIEQGAALTGINNPDGDKAPSLRVIADHLRSSAFLIADGVLPSNEGRGYVLRRIMRRGMRHAQLLGAKEPLLYRLLPTLLAKMGGAYPELERAEALITETLRSEEERFKKTLDRGLKLLEEETSKIGAGKSLPGEVAFRLYDTFGFPLDLTQDALKAQGIAVDVAGFEKSMADQKAVARKSWAGSGGVGEDKVWFDALNDTGPTEFLGYESEIAEAKIEAIYKLQKNSFLESGKSSVEDKGLLSQEPLLREGESGFIITNQTPFYAESGGQVGDTGTMNGIASPDGKLKASSFIVTDTKKQLGKLWVHLVTSQKGELHKGQAVELKIDRARRAAIESNHSATHLLHEALRQVLGDHVHQKGSLQDEDRTRFDVSHPKQITREELDKVEGIVNREIKADTEIVTRVMPLDEARETGAMALFGEKYDDEVRVVSMGSKAPGANKVFSVELCGGTHVGKTGDIGRLKIVSEGSLSSGVRRVEAVTGKRADRYDAQKEQGQKDAAAKLAAENTKLREELKALGGVVPASDGDIDKDNKRLEKMISQQRLNNVSTSDATAASDRMNAGHSGVRDIRDGKLHFKIIDNFPASDLKPLADDMKAKLSNSVIVLVALNDGKASLVVAVTKDLTSKINAVDLVKIGAAALGGQGGGGRPDMAQAGGPNAGAANDSVTAIEKALSA